MAEIPSKVWIFPDSLGWDSFAESSTNLDDRHYRRAYDKWRHADQILRVHSDDDHRVDAITSLKRAVNLRIRNLTDLYKFNKIPIKDKPSGTFELLEYLGLIRAMMMKRLLDIRNAIEHEDKPPPGINDCYTFVEFVWYFLRSTDPLIRQYTDSILFIPDDPQKYWLSIKLGPGAGWIPKVRGWLKPKMVSVEARDMWILVKVNEMGTRKQFLQQLGKRVHMQNGEPYLGGGIDPEDIYLSGEILGPVECLHEIILRYFELN